MPSPWVKPGRDKWTLLCELTAYAAGKKVGIWVWKRWKTGQTEGIQMEGLDDPTSRREFFRQCKEAGVAGIKIDFMDSESKGIINGGTARSYSLELSFLGEGEYSGVYLADNPQRPDDRRPTQATVQGGSSREVKTNAGGGFVAMFEPVRR